jgi:hypothetical protein
MYYGLMGATRSRLDTVCTSTIFKKKDGNIWDHPPQYLLPKDFPQGNQQMQQHILSRFVLIVVFLAGCVLAMSIDSETNEKNTTYKIHRLVN